MSKNPPPPCDPLGSTSLLLDSSGGVLQRACYDPFGTERFETNLSATHYTYTGQYSYTDDFGLMFYNARFYSSELGRFSQADTIIPGPGNPLAWDRYAGMANNPLRYTDPTGHCAGDPKDPNNPDKACWEMVTSIQNLYGISLTNPEHKKWTTETLQWLIGAIDNYKENFTGSGLWRVFYSGLSITIDDTLSSDGFYSSYNVAINPRVFSAIGNMTGQQFFSKTLSHEFTHHFVASVTRGEMIWDNPNLLEPDLNMGFEHFAQQGDGPTEYSNSQYYYDEYGQIHKTYDPEEDACETVAVNLVPQANELGLTDGRKEWYSKWQTRNKLTSFILAFWGIQ